jgi:hypothetical protein
VTAKKETVLKFAEIIIPIAFFYTEDRDAEIIQRNAFYHFLNLCIDSILYPLCKKHRLQLTARLSKRSIQQSSGFE